MIPLGPVVARSKARAARAAVWQYLVDSERRKVWWPELRLDPRVGGAVSERWAETSGDSEVSRDASGEVDVLVEGHAIGFRWSEAGDEHSTAVLVTLRSRGPDTGITVTETGFDALSSPAESAAASQEGWHVLLGDLVEAVEAAVASGAYSEDVAEPIEVVQTVDVVEVEDESLDEGDSVVEETEAVSPEPESEPEPELETEPEPEILEGEPEPPAGELESEQPADETDEADEVEDGSDPEEPNFDDLIRGPQAN